MTAKVTPHTEKHLLVRAGYEHDGDRDTILANIAGKDETIPGQLWERLREYGFHVTVERILNQQKLVLDRLK